MTRRASSQGRRSFAQIGMTFVELIMAAVVFSILLVGVSGHLRGSVLAWRRVTSTVERLQQSRVALDTLGQDLANAFVFESTTTPPFAVSELAADHLRCYTVHPAGTGATSGDRAQVVTYQVSAVDGIPSLVRIGQSIQSAASAPPAVTEALVGSVAQLSLRYGTLVVLDGQPSQIVWGDWPDATQLPKLVEVTVTLAPSPGNLSDATHQIRQIFTIPSGSLTPAESPPS